MKATTISAILAPALVNAQWWGGSPECAHDCFSSYWSSENNWPAATSYCSANHGASVSSCISSACTATPTAIASYSSLSSDLCSRWASCSSAGSTGVYTIDIPAFTGVWPWPGGNKDGSGPRRGPWGIPDPDQDGDGDVDWDDWKTWVPGADWNPVTKTWTGGQYTVTGCEWNGSPWAGGPWGYGPGGQGGPGGGPWGNWGAGWKWSTETKTITQVIPVTTAGSTSLSTTVGLATVAEAVSGQVTQTSIVQGGAVTTGGGSGETGGNGSAAPGSISEGLAVKVVGALLGGFLVVAGLL